MTRSQKGKSVVERVLAYCGVREHIARVRHERWLVLHWQSVSLTVAEAFYGVEPPLHRFCHTQRVLPQPAIRPKTAYQLDVLRQPRQRVVTQVHSREFDEHLRRQIDHYTDVLACGHKLPVYTGPYLGTMTRYRRCSQCQKQRTYRRTEQKAKAS